MKPIIRVENLGKQYHIGASQKRHDTVRDALASAMRSTLARFKSGNGSGGDQTIWALREVNFEVKPGEVVGIIGRNGAGKSTLLKILSRITEPTTGEVELYGRVASLLEVGTGFHGELTGRENILLNGALLGMKRTEIQNKFDDIVAFAEIDKFIDTPVKHYSSGMYMRLAFAVAAYLDPEILLVDEVLAVGDVNFQKKCLGKMEESANEGRTILFISHNMSAIQQLCSKAILIIGGMIQEQGETEAVVERYLEDAYLSETGEFDLSRHPARAPRMEPVFKYLRLYAHDGSPTSVFHPGDELIVELTLESERLLREPRVALGIEDSLGRRLTTVATTFQNQSLGDIEGIVKVNCTIPCLSFGAGRYIISVSLRNTDYGWIDMLHNVICFDIVWNNSYGTGEPYHMYYGPVLTPAEWNRVV